MNNFYNNHNNRNSSEHLENMYPEIYKELHPFVLEAANDFLRKGFTLTTEFLNSMVDGIIKKSGMWDEDNDNDMNDYPSQYVGTQYVSTQPFRRPRRRFHNRNTLRDILKILLLREILSR